MAESFVSRYFSGQGPVFIGQRDASGNPINLQFIGDISTAELTPAVENAEIVENVSGSGGIGAQFNRSTKYDFSLTLRSIKPEHAKIALQGNNTVIASGSVTNQAHTAKLGGFNVLQHVKVSSVVVTNTAGTTTYVAGTDYVLHADKGLIEILSTGTITADQIIHVDYTYAAQHKITAAPTNQDLYLVFAGVNRADNNKQTRCEIYKLNLSATAYGFIQDGFLEAPITGTVLIDSLRASGDQFFSWKTED